MKKAGSRVWVIVLSAALLISVGLNVFLAFSGTDSYLQSADEIYIMESGILTVCLELAEGQDLDFVYDMDCEDYAELISRYGIDKTAGEGSELERALRLMDEYSPRLVHESCFDGSVELRALPLLEYSLDNRHNGINCRCKSQILNEMCLALGICSRKVWLMPVSPYDTDCHVVNEVWDSTLNKWVMLDITNNKYWVDENGTPLSVLEIRSKGANNEFCTPAEPGESLKNPGRLKEKHIGNFLYIMKNMAYLEYLDVYTAGESGNIYLLFPGSLETDYKLLVSEESVLRPPMQ